MVDMYIWTQYDTPESLRKRIPDRYCVQPCGWFWREVVHEFPDEAVARDELDLAVARWKDKGKDVRVIDDRLAPYVGRSDSRKGRPVRNIPLVERLMPPTFL